MRTVPCSGHPSCYAHMTPPLPCMPPHHAQPLPHIPPHHTWPLLPCTPPQPCMPPPQEQNHRCKKHYLSATTVADSKYSHVTKFEVKSLTRKHSSRMRTDRAITRMTNDRAAMWTIVDRQTPVKTLPSLTVGNN